MSTPESPYGYLQRESGPTLRHGHWPCSRGEPKGTVLILQGRSEFMEKYEETIASLHDRRFDVFSFDWRGQGLSDRVPANPEKGFVRHYDDYLEDLDIILEHVVRPNLRGPLYFLSHSMGGHIGLRYLYRMESPDGTANPVAKAVFCAPMIDIDTRPFPSIFTKWLCRWQVGKGRFDRMVFASAQKTPFPKKFKGNLLTSDRRRFDRNRKMVTDRPGFFAARITCGWLAASYDSIDILKKSGRESTLKIPILIVNAGEDRIVSNRAIRAFAKRVSHCRLVTIDSARHEILQESDRNRYLFWRAFDTFIGSKSGSG